MKGLNYLSAKDAVFLFEVSPVEQLMTHTVIYFKYVVHSISFHTFFFVQAFKIVEHSWKFIILLLYILRGDWSIFMISNMQTGREDTLKERYAIKFYFKLEKNARITYGMLQNAFWPSCMNRASVFEWHKRFTKGRESVRDDERCERSKEVNTPEMIV